MLIAQIGEEIYNGKPLDVMVIESNREEDKLMGSNKEVGAVCQVVQGTNCRSQILSTYCRAVMKGPLLMLWKVAVLGDNGFYRALQMEPSRLFQDVAGQTRQDVAPALDSLPKCAVQAVAVKTMKLVYPGALIRGTVRKVFLSC